MPLVKRDADAALQVWQDDDEVDTLYDQIYRELLLFMARDPKDHPERYLSLMGSP